MKNGLLLALTIEEANCFQSARRARVESQNPKVAELTKEDAQIWDVLGALTRWHAGRILGVAPRSMRRESVARSVLRFERSST